MDFSIIDELRKFPYIRLTIPLIIGILVGLNFQISLYFSILLFSIALIFFIFINFKKKKQYTILVGISINVMILALGLFLVQNSLTSGKIDKIEELNKENGLLLGEISDSPKVKEKIITLNINIIAIRSDKNWLSSSGKTILYIVKDSLSEKLSLGNIIAFNPKLQEIENSGNPEEFDYKKYLSYNFINTSAYLETNDWHLVDNQNNTTKKYEILKFRNKLINLLAKSGLENDELAVMSALALGYSNDLSAEIKHNYSSAGAMHILAVSGMHVGIIFGIITFIFSFIKHKKFQPIITILSITIIWFYALLTGLSPSVARSALMFLIIALGKFQKNKTQTLNAVAFSAFILLIINPLNITNIGFQLSYIAVIGILIFQQPFQNLYTPKTKFGNWIWSLTCVSIAAQIATAPICIYYFHQFSNYFLLTNYILIPVSTIAIWLCVIVYTFSWWNWATLLLGKILSFVIKVMNYSTNFIDNMPFSVTENIYINLSQTIILYLIIITIFMFFFITKKYKHLIISVIGMILFFAINLFQTLTTKDQKYMIVYNINKVTAINLIDNQNNILFANFENLDKNKIEYSVKNNWLKKGLNSEKYINLYFDKKNLLSNIVTINQKNIFFKQKFIGFEDYKIFILDENFEQKNMINLDKADVDFIIISNSPEIKLADIPKLFKFKKIIIDSSNSFKKNDEWEKEEIYFREKIHNVKLSGAYIFDLNKKIF
ncbi:MAG: competence protein ComEC family protein [Bacteroidales bacterium]|jgi:competence protein ComEC|nr:competence protein ComEC family protein [Bacteroidales bacterium]